LSARRIQAHEIIHRSTFIFVERSSTIECYRQSPPQKIGNGYKQARLFYTTNKYLKNDTGYHLARALLAHWHIPKRSKMNVCAAFKLVV
jgi:hypothetical protein